SPSVRQHVALRSAARIGRRAPLRRGRRARRHASLHAAHRGERSMTTTRTRRIVRSTILIAALPIALYALLVAWLDGTDAATLMLGAVSGASYATLAAMALALLLRVYVMVVLPGIAAYAATRILWEKVRTLATRRRDLT